MSRDKIKLAMRKTSWAEADPKTWQSIESIIPRSVMHSLSSDDIALLFTAIRSKYEIRPEPAHDLPLNQDAIHSIRYEQ